MAVRDCGEIWGRNRGVGKGCEGLGSALGGSARTRTQFLCSCMERCRWHVPQKLSAFLLPFPVPKTTWVLSWPWDGAAAAPEPFCVPTWLQSGKVRCRPPSFCPRFPHLFAVLAGDFPMRREALRALILLCFAILGTLCSTKERTTQRCSSCGVDGHWVHSCVPVWHAAHVGW